MKDKRWAMVIDLQRCTGCGGCILTCKNESNLQDGVAWSSRIIKTVGKFPHVRMEYIPTLCNHCENAPCVTGCPTGAMHKGCGGITLHDPAICIGCRTCKAVCPYDVIHINAKKPHPFWRNGKKLIDGVTATPSEVTQRVRGNVIPYYNPDKEKSFPGAGLRYKGIPEKCTLCDHRVKDGKIPYCVLGCPTSARIFGDLNDPDSDVSKILGKYRPWRLKEHLGTEPKIFYVRSFNPGTYETTRGKV
ncbi:MAG: 4Fe-4S dicluster domain-containing protein [Candidatus Hydrogenedentota bacterium]|nr:MAG: 4Fe-4S dicluster domain-containing protein [Candidatus Hydrogenedentota bacterium]